MATIALPIRELSADAQFEAASVQKAFWSVADGVQRRQFHLWLLYKTHELNNSMGRLIGSQERLISSLQDAAMQQFSMEDIKKQACDLDILVAMTTAFVDTASEMPPKCLDVWAPKLDMISELAGHLDSIAASLHLEADEEGSLLLAVAVEEISSTVAQEVAMR
jgi:hypothetical protein